MELNHEKGWSGDLSFLESWQALRAFTIIDFTIKTVEPVHQLRELRALEVLTYCDTTLRFSAFPYLEDCGIEWRAGAESVFDRTSLRNLYINRYHGRDLVAFSNLKNLTSLTLLDAPIATLSGIESLANLRFLRLGHLRRLRSLAHLEHLKQLEHLEVHTCPGISSIDELGTLTNLKTLHLNNSGTIASLRPLNALRNLETVLFYESTNVADGDLTPLTRQRELSRVAFQNRRHYSHTREQFRPAFPG